MSEMCPRCQKPRLIHNLVKRWWNCFGCGYREDVIARKIRQSVGVVFS